MHSAGAPGFGLVQQAASGCGFPEFVQVWKLGGDAVPEHVRALRSAWLDLGASDDDGMAAIEESDDAIVGSQRSRGKGGRCVGVEFDKAQAGVVAWWDCDAVPEGTASTHIIKVAHFLEVDGTGLAALSFSKAVCVLELCLSGIRFWMSSLPQPCCLVLFDMLLEPALHCFAIVF